MTLEQMLNEGAKVLLEHDVPEAELNAWYLLQFCYSGEEVLFRRNDYFLRRAEMVPDDIWMQYQSLLEKRTKRIPLEHITGYTEFMGLTFGVNEHVLIPRQDTETLVEYILPKCEKKRVLDLCTGSGCIGLSIAALGNPAEVMLSDVSKKACEKAAENLQRIRQSEGENLSCHVDIVCGDLWQAVTGRFDVIVSNPPYIESEVIPTLMPEVKDFEPMTALDGGDDGLYFYRSIVQGATEYLTSEGMLAFEIGHNQGKSVAKLMSENGFIDVEIKKDLAGNDRVVVGRLEEFDV